MTPSVGCVPVGADLRAARLAGSRRLGRSRGPRKSPTKWVLWGEEEQGSVRSFRQGRKRSEADFATTLSRLAPSATGHKPYDCGQTHPGLRPSLGFAHPLPSYAPASGCSDASLSRLAPSATGHKPYDCGQTHPGLCPSLGFAHSLPSYVPAPGCSDASMSADSSASLPISGDTRRG